MMGLLTRLAGGITSIKGLFLIGLLCFSTGSGLTLYVKGKFDDAAKLEVAEKAMAEQRAAVEHTIKIMNERQAVKDQLVERQIENIKRAAKAEVIVKEIVKYVPSDDPIECNVPTGAVGMLNYARTADSAWLPDSAEITEDEARAPSAITRREEFDAHAQCGIEYNKLANQLNLILDWHEETEKSEAIQGSKRE